LNSSFPSDELEEARRLGRLEAERFNLSLREREGREREERLVRLAFGADGSCDTGASFADDGSSTLWRLQQENERLAEFHRAVVTSKAWRLAQALRRPFGRAW
jgi:hypothetical protein